jgi:hypothetical protein
MTTIYPGYTDDILSLVIEKQNGNQKVTINNNMYTEKNNGVLKPSVVGSSVSYQKSFANKTVSESFIGADTATGVLVQTSATLQKGDGYRNSSVSLSGGYNFGTDLSVGKIGEVKIQESNKFGDKVCATYNLTGNAMTLGVGVERAGCGTSINIDSDGNPSLGITISKGGFESNASANGGGFSFQFGYSM